MKRDTFIHRTSYSAAGTLDVLPVKIRKNYGKICIQNFAVRNKTTANCMISQGIGDINDYHILHTTASAAQYEASNINQELWIEGNMPLIVEVRAANANDVIEVVVTGYGLINEET